MTSSYHYHRINSIQDETNLLKQIIDLETQVRAKREKERLTSNSESERYAKIFEPITQSMKTLHTIANGSRGGPSSSPSSNNGNNNNNNSSTIGTEVVESNPMNEETSFTAAAAVSPNQEDEGEKDDNLYNRALNEVQKKQRDDGVYGINWKKRTIGGKEFTVKNGNILQVRINSSEQRNYKITNMNVWKLLLYQNLVNKVSTQTENGEPTPAVRQYQEIADELNLVDYAKRHLQSPLAYKKRMKYKIISNRKKEEAGGSGFLFSIQKPSSFTKVAAAVAAKKKRKKEGNGLLKKVKHHHRKQLFKPSTVVIPSDKKGLLNALVKATAEMKAGNSSMRNLVVPLEQEARRRGILPINYSDAINGDDDNLNWIYA